MKKWLSLLLVLALMLALCAGCGRDKNNNADADAAQTQQSGVQTADDGISSAGDNTVTFDAPEVPSSEGDNTVSFGATDDASGAETPSGTDTASETAPVTGESGSQSVAEGEFSPPV